MNSKRLLEVNPDDTGIVCVSRFYHEAMVLVLHERGQNYRQAASFLEISLTTFSKTIRLQLVPKFHTERGKQLAQRFEEWSGVPTWLLFPEAFFTKEFLKAPKTVIGHRSFRRLMQMGGQDLTFALPAPRTSKHHQKMAPRKKRTRRRRK